ncbi:putative rieske (2Fe-2S) domain protein [Luminiphilus syltensis NOR5-1B]|uniref:Putative rieske (2Fe-2S) domain protein n=1 Tax=Luminiphilus syltensis NOR5-1B TaxID=565045 RepID=B8KRM5_9GAMM|nr:Rieske (2Fe-2S) protein [Luminiphilus syltensis]EED34531.1 putative rieske (2Fe-2S) domain protein [Luminiphilus syltensis NOR5-1B]
MRFLPLDKLINLHDGYRRAFKIDQLEILLLQEAGKVWAVSSRCPHQEQSLIDAEIIDEQLLCPRHHFAFELANDGVQVDGLCASLKVFATAYEGNEIGILLP